MSLAPNSVSMAVNHSFGSIDYDAEKSLSADAIHVWRVALDQSSVRTARALNVLSENEREAAARFHFEKDRSRFVQARAALRIILAGYSKVHPRSLVFTFGPHGKPRLASGRLNADLRFNLSRRDGIALIAVTCGREIGIDVELMRPDIPFFEVAGVSFSASELAALHALPEGLTRQGFYNCWTRKEAFVKAVGEGLSFPLKEFDVSLTPGEQARLLEVRGAGSRRDEDARWNLRDVSVSENYVAALVVEGAACEISYFDWSWDSVDDGRPLMP